MLNPLRILGAASLLVACVPSSRAESEPIQQPAQAVAAITSTDESDTGGADEPENDEPPAEVIADSKLVEHFVVDPTVAPSLIEFSQDLAQAGSLWLGKLEGNGGRDVLIFIPPGAKDAAQFEFV